MNFETKKWSSNANLTVQKLKNLTDLNKKKKVICVYA